MKPFHRIPLLACCLFAAFSASSQEAAAPDTALLQRGLDFVKGLESFSTEVTMRFDLADKSGRTRDGELTGKLDIAGTDKARFRVNTEQGALELFYGPDSKLIYMEEGNQYVEGDRFGDRREVLGVMPSNEFSPAQVLLSDFVHGSPSILENITTATTDGQDGAADTPLHIQVSDGEITTDFWFRRGEQPLLEKFSVDLLKMASASNPDLTKVVLTYTFANWNTSPGFAEDHFTFKKPEGATAVDPSAPRGEVESLEGKAAPQIELPLLGGGTMNLASHKDKDVVVLDFWASWCGPCRKGLPIASEVTATFKDKNVVFYAVNVGENAEAAQGFLDQMKLSMPVALDEQTVAASKYGAVSIPQMVIIGKDGVVKKVEVGLSPNLKEELTATLTELSK